MLKVSEVCFWGRYTWLPVFVTLWWCACVVLSVSGYSLLSPCCPCLRSVYLRPFHHSSKGVCCFVFHYPMKGGWVGNDMQCNELVLKYKMYVRTLRVKLHGFGWEVCHATSL